jgi:hypothetical protein
MDDSNRLVVPIWWTLPLLAPLCSAVAVSGGVAVAAYALTDTDIPWGYSVASALNKGGYICKSRFGCVCAFRRRH